MNRLFRWLIVRRLLPGWVRRAILFVWERRQKRALADLLLSRGESEDALKILIEHALGRRLKPGLIKRFGMKLRWGDARE